MIPVALHHILDSPVGEGTVRAIQIADVQVPDGAGGVRFPSAGELAGLELTITDVDTGAVIVDTVLLLPDHGSYNSLTGVLLITLVAADNVIVNAALTPGWQERHLVFVHAPDLLWAEIVISVQKQGRTP